MPRYPVDNRIKVPGQIPFGEPDPNAKYKRHSGDDSANGVGTPVYAPASGKVTGYVTSQYHGNVVEIFDGQYYPHCFHLSRRVVEPGTRVTEGQLIGYTGNTGLSTGPHIHFGVSKKSVPNTTSFSDFINPMEYIKEGGNDMIPDRKHLDLVFQRFFRRNSTPAEQAEWIGKKTYTQLLDVLITQKAYFDSIKSNEVGEVAIRDKWEQQILDLKKQLASEAKVLAPGKYFVN